MIAAQLKACPRILSALLYPAGAVPAQDNILDRCQVIVPAQPEDHACPVTTTGPGITNEGLVHRLVAIPARLPPAITDKARLDPGLPHPLPLQREHHPAGFYHEPVHTPAGAGRQPVFRNWRLLVIGPSEVIVSHPFMGDTVAFVGGNRQTWFQ